MKKEEIDSIETDRLVLRRFRRNDLDELAEVLGNPEVMRFSLSGPYSRRKSEEFIEGCVSVYDHRGVGLFAMVAKERQNVIGYCGFYFLTIDSQEEIEIGYRLHPTYWNRGLATEAAKATQNLGFDRLDFNRMISIIEPENIASVRVAEKIGMKHEKDAIFKDRVSVRIYVIEKR